MSAYVVEDKTINTVLAYLHGQAWGIANWHRLDLRPLAAAEYILDATNAPTDEGLRAELSRLGRTMHLLNVGSFRQRYEDADAAGMIPKEFSYRPLKPPTPVQAYKALQCWLYQCCEGTADRANLYCAMEATLNNIAAQIVASLPEYETAAWG